MNDAQYREGGVWILQRYFEKKGDNASDFFDNFRGELLRMAENDIHLLQYHRSHILKSIDLVDFFNLDRQSLIVDVGGFDGEVAKIFAQSLPESTVLTFEPVNSTFNNLLKTISGIKNIRAYNFGLGSCVKTSVINKTDNVSSSSLIAVDSAIGDEFFSKNLKVNDTEEITVRTLDTEIAVGELVNILKIDVQGYEMEVLLGAEQTLSRTNIVLVEMQNHQFYKNAPQYHEIDSFLLSKNFVLFDIMPALRKKRKLYEWDAIYVKDTLARA